MRWRGHTLSCKGKEICWKVTFFSLQTYLSSRDKSSFSFIAISAAAVKIFQIFFAAVPKSNSRVTLQLQK